MPLKRTPSPKNTWLIGFTDVIALMLTFFVMTYSMANPKQEVWDDIKDQVNMEFSKTLGAVAQRGDVNDISLERLNFEQALNLSYLEALLTNQLKERQISKQVTLINDKQQKRLIITIPNESLFQVGDATIPTANQKIIKELADILNGIHNSIEIVGHTDPTPIKIGASDYLSNWDLSLQRAINVSNIFKQNGYNAPIHIRGSSDSLYKSLSKSIPEEQRMSMSRRIDMIVYDTKEGFRKRINK